MKYISKLQISALFICSSIILNGLLFLSINSGAINKGVLIENEISGDNTDKDTMLFELNYLTFVPIGLMLIVLRQMNRILREINLAFTTI